MEIIIKSVGIGAKHEGYNPYLYILAKLRSGKEITLFLFFTYLTPDPVYHLVMLQSFMNSELIENRLNFYRMEAIPGNDMGEIYTYPKLLNSSYSVFIYLKFRNPK